MRNSPAPRETHFEQAIRLQPLFLQWPREQWTSQFSEEAKLLFSPSKNRRLRRFIFVGTGSSFHVALWAQWLCSHYGLDARALSSWDVLTGGAILSPQLDTVFAISHRGSAGLTKMLLAEIKHLHHVLIASNGAPTGDSPYAFCSPPESSKAYSMSLVGSLCAITELLALNSPASLSRSLTDHRQATGRLLTRSTARPTSFSVPRLARTATVHVVGGGPFEAIAHEVSLKAKEMAHIPALSYNTEEFLHAPLAAVRPGDHVVMLDPVHAPRSSKINSIYDLLRLKRPLDGVKAARTLKAVVLKPKLPLELAPPWQAVLALAFGQQLCLEYARQRGTNPDLNHQDDALYAKAFKQALI